MRIWSHYQPAVNMGHTGPMHPSCCFTAMEPQKTHKNSVLFCTASCCTARVKHDFVKFPCLCGKTRGNLTFLFWSGETLHFCFDPTGCPKNLTFQSFHRSSLIGITLRNKPLHHSPNLFTSDFVVGPGNHKKSVRYLFKDVFFSLSDGFKTNPPTLAVLNSE